MLHLVYEFAQANIRVEHAHSVRSTSKVGHLCSRLTRGRYALRVRTSPLVGEYANGV